MEKLLAALDVFRKGSSVANATAWKQHQVTTTMLAVLIVALVRLAKAMGYDVPIDEDTATAIGGGIIAIVNIVLTYITSSKVGVLQPKTADVARTTDTPEQPMVSETPAEAVQPEPAKSNPEDFLAEARAAMAAHHAQQFDDTNTGH